MRGGLERGARSFDAAAVRQPPLRNVTRAPLAANILREERDPFPNRHHEEQRARRVRRPHRVRLEQLRELHLREAFALRGVRDAPQRMAAKQAGKIERCVVVQIERRHVLEAETVAVVPTRQPAGEVGEQRGGVHHISCFSARSVHTWRVLYKKSG